MLFPVRGAICPMRSSASEARDRIDISRHICSQLLLRGDVLRVFIFFPRRGRAQQVVAWSGLGIELAEVARTRDATFAECGGAPRARTTRSICSSASVVHRGGVPSTSHLLRRTGAERFHASRYAPVRRYVSKARPRFRASKPASNPSSSPRRDWLLPFRTQPCVRLRFSDATRSRALTTIHLNFSSHSIGTRPA